MAEEVTVMVLGVDLECHKCYSKVKKLLSRYPEIQNPVFNEEADTVTITVECCSAERIRKKLISKGGKTIKRIETRVMEKPKPPPENRDKTTGEAMPKVTIMVLRVDLECHKCYRKIKRLLCKYPEIQNQQYYNDIDTVMITVVCCSPERIRQKLISNGGKTIKSIEMRVPEMPYIPTGRKT